MAKGSVDMNGFTGSNDLPLGLGMAMARNMSAMEQFSMMSDSQRELIVKGAGDIRSKKDMQSYVQKIAEGRLPGGM